MSQHIVDTLYLCTRVCVQVVTQMQECCAPMHTTGIEHVFMPCFLGATACAMADGETSWTLCSAVQGRGQGTCRPYSRGVSCSHRMLPPATQARGSVLALSILCKGSNMYEVICKYLAVYFQGEGTFGFYYYKYMSHGACSHLVTKQNYTLLQIRLCCLVRFKLPFQPFLYIIIIL